MLICTQQCVLIRGMWVLNEVLSSVEWRWTEIGPTLATMLQALWYLWPAGVGGSLWYPSPKITFPPGPINHLKYPSSVHLRTTFVKDVHILFQLFFCHQIDSSAASVLGKGNYLLKTPRFVVCYTQNKSTLFFSVYCSKQLKKKNSEKIQRLL